MAEVKATYKVVSINSTSYKRSDKINGTDVI